MHRMERGLQAIVLTQQRLDGAQFCQLVLASPQRFQRFDQFIERGLGRFMRAIQLLPFSRFGLRVAPDLPLLIQLATRLIDHRILRTTVGAIELFDIGI
jgi:hypothetical protein